MYMLGPSSKVARGDRKGNKMDIAAFLCELASEPGQPGPATAPDTATMLKYMLTQDTGQHVLDSGGAYGRAWQRNQGKDFDAEPDAWYEASIYHASYDNEKHMSWDFTISVYKYLLDRLDYDAETDRAFQIFRATSDEYGYGVAEEFAEARGGRAFGDTGFVTCNTYNGEDALSQIIQFTTWNDPSDDECYVALSIHGGCDARGGYSDIHVFRCYEMESMFDQARLYLYCDGRNPNAGQMRFDGTIEPHSCQAGWTSDNAGYSWDDGGFAYPESYSLDLPFEEGETGKFDILVVNDKGEVFCPVCANGILHADSSHCG